MNDFQVAIEKFGYYHGFQRQRDAKTGEYFWIYVNFRVFERDKKGNLKKIIGVATFIDDGFHSPTQTDYFFKDLQKRKQQSKLENLSEREKEVALLICDGKREKEIARELYISANTVRNHRQNIYRKLGVSSSVDLFKAVNGL